MVTPLLSPRTGSGCRAIRLLVAVALLAGTTACGSNIPKADAYEQMADGMMTSQAYPAAIASMEKSVKYDSNEPRRWLKLGRAQRAADQPALAAISYQHALDLDPSSLEGLENMSILLVRAGRYSEARSYVDPLMVLAPDDVAGLLAMGAIALFQQRYDEADKYADRLIKIAPTSIGGYSLKAHVLDAQGRPAAAAALLAKQVALNPDDLDLALQLIELYRRSGNVDGVRAASLSLARLSPDDPRYQLESARALHARGQDGEAAKVLAKLQQRYRGNPDVISAIADYWLSTLPRDAALQRIAGMTAQLAGRSQAALADVLVDQGRADEAARLLAPVAAAKVTSGAIDVHASYAGALLALGRADDALAAAQAVLAFDGTNNAALLVRARVRMARGKLDDALNDAQLAASNDAQDEGAALLVPRVYAALGNKVLAEKAWGEAQSDLPDSIAIHRARMAWLSGQGRTADAIQIAAVFARAHARNAEAWRLYRELCGKANDATCVTTTTARLKALGTS